MLLKPMMKLVGNMHGNEAVGRELLLALATLILRDHEQDRAANEGSQRFHNHGEGPCGGFLRNYEPSCGPSFEALAQEPRLARILDTTDLHILASLNPDGFENSTKGVCRGYHVGTGRHNGNMVRC